MNSTLNVEENLMYSDLLIYPNPANTIISVEFNAEFQSNGMVFLHDSKGRLVQTSKEHINNGNNTLTFNVGALAQGMYLITISDGINAVSRQLVVKR